jgi:hypothetical protein
MKIEEVKELNQEEKEILYDVDQFLIKEERFRIENEEELNVNDIVPLNISKHIGIKID